VVTTDGKVGIGTSTPLGKLEVRSSSNYARKGQIILEPGVYASPESGTDVPNWIRSEYVSNSNWDLGLGGSSYNGGQPNVIIKKNGWVGVGTISPNGKLHVNNDVSGSDSSIVVTTDGKVGIGTSTPTDKLMIRSNDGLSLGFKVVENVNYAEIQTNKSGGSHLALQKSGGFVGIGTSAPDRSLTIESAQYNPLRLKSLTDGCYVELFTPAFSSSTSRAGWFGYSSSTSKSLDITNQISSGSIKLRTNNLDRVTVDSTGNVGISTNVPTAKLHISGGGIKLDGNTFAGIGFAGADPSETTTGLSDNAKIYMDSGADLFNGSSNNDALVIEKCDGNTTPGDGGIIFANRGSDGIRNSSLVIRSTGNVGIGTSSPSAKLDVAGTVKIADGTQGAGKVLTSDASGNATWQATAVSTGSFTNMQVYSAAGSSTFTVPAGVTKIMVEVWGGGGGGGNSSATVTGTVGSGAGGGYGRSIISVVPGENYSVIVGAGGTAGSGDGGTSSFGTILNATGGIGGNSIGGTSFKTPNGGTSNGSFNVTGGQGVFAGSMGGAGSYGGGSYGSHGGRGGLSGIAASMGNAPGGGGGSGAGGSSSTGYTSGAAGGVGRVVIWY
jgi:hypothetical protein